MEVCTDGTTSVLKCNEQDPYELKKVIRDQYATRKRDSMIENPNSMLGGHLQAQMKFKSSSSKMDDMNENSSIS